MIHYNKFLIVARCGPGFTSAMETTHGTTGSRRYRPGNEATTWIATLALVVAGSLLPQPQWSLLTEVAVGFLQLTPVIAVAAALAGVLAVTDLSARITRWMDGGMLRAVVIGSLGGALTPVCGLGIVPLIAVLLRRGIPLPAVMAFWVSSPVTDPGMLVVTAGVLGLPFAIAKTVAAFGAGLFAGLMTALPPLERMTHGHILKDGVAAMDCCPGTAAGRWRAFAVEAWANGRLIARWLALALVLEVLLQRHVSASLIEAALGSGMLAVPLAAVVGAPLYLDGYAALPLVRGLAELGMSSGAVMALLISGAAVSLYAAVAVYSLVRWPVFLLYTVLAVASAVLAGYTIQVLGIPIATS